MDSCWPPMRRRAMSKCGRWHNGSWDERKATFDIASASALHSDEVGAEYDLILLDCPPRLTTACINALCCCDGVLIPVKPDNVSHSSRSAFVATYPLIESE